MSYLDHVRKAGEHLKIATAQMLTDDSRPMVLWKYYPMVVRLMLKTIGLLEQLERAQPRRDTP